MTKGRICAERCYKSNADNKDLFRHASLGMNRGGTTRWEGARRSSTVTRRFVRVMGDTGRASSPSNSSLAEGWGLVVTAAATLATLALSLGGNSRHGVISSSDHMGNPSLFASPQQRGGISIVQQSRGRLLQENSGAVTTRTAVQYETKLQLFMCNPSLAEEGNDAYQVDDARLATALSKVSGLRQVRESALSAPD